MRAPAAGSAVRWRALAVLLAGLALALPVAAEQRRIVAVGDIHGAYESFVDILQRAALIDDDLGWIGGNAVLVQTGDVFDRGVGVLQTFELLRRLETEAAAAGGEVVVLMGNHEAMNLLGFRRDVNPELYAQFSKGAATEALQDERLDEYRRWLVQRARVANERRPSFGREFDEAWMEQNPPGTYEYIEALSPSSSLGQWLRQRPMVAKVDGFVFLHGGLAPNYVNTPIESLNQAAWNEIERLDGCRQELLASEVVHPLSDPSDMVREGLAQLERVSKRLEKRLADEEREKLEYTRGVLEHCVDYEDWFLVREDSPVWFRGYARGDEEAAAELVRQGLRRHAARAFVVGHTPQRSGRIETRFGGRVFLIDTGMLEAVYSGAPSALEIGAEAVQAHYLDGRQELVALAEIPPMQGVGRLFHSASGELLPFQDDDQIVAFLETAEIVPLGETAKGINKPLKVELRHGNITAWGIFRDVDIVKERHRDRKGNFFPRFKDSFRFEVAAYEVDRAIGLRRVPPAVQRRLGNRLGSLQIWLHGVIDEEDRREAGIDPPDPVAFAQQNIMRRFFDNLIANFDRNLGNILIDEDTFRVWFIDHTRSFLEESELRTPEEVTQCDHEIWRRFVAADLDALEERLADTLTGGEIKSLRARWQALEELLRGRIAELGERAVLFDLRQQ